MERGGDGGGELSQGGPPFRWGKAVWAALAHAERVAIVYSALLFVACVAIIAVETDRAYMGTGFTTVSSHTLSVWAAILTGKLPPNTRPVK